MTKEDTKQKIIEAANKLFAKNGFAGTSIRDIAGLAEVNLASINYHFQNKENLYWKVFDYNYLWMDDSINKLGEKAKNTEELAIFVFRFFMANEHAMMNTFKIFLSDISIPKEGLLLNEQEKFGPPGQEIFLEKISHDLSDDVPEESKVWGMKMIFSLLFHFGVVLNTEMMKRKCEIDDQYKPQEMEKAVRHAVRSHLAYLKSNPKLK